MKDLPLQLYSIKGYKPRVYSYGLCIIKNSDSFISWWSDYTLSLQIPIDVDHTSTCAIKKGTVVTRLIQATSLIVWGEAPMVHHLSLEVIDRTLCDIMNIPSDGPGYKPFGGKTVFHGGDFRQALPVIQNGRREDNVGASLTRSYL
ncbi:hypothetical protein LINPERPRIM_LOCUS37583 [Linum perenne]